MKKICILIALVIAMATSQAHYTDVEVNDHPYKNAHIIQTEAPSNPSPANLSDALIWAVYTYQGFNELEAVKSTLSPATIVENDCEVFRKFNRSAKSSVHTSI